MQHQDGARKRVLAVVPVVGLEVDREEGRVPIVRHKHDSVPVRRPAARNNARRLQRGPAEQGVAQGDVGGGPGVEVAAGPALEAGGVDKDDVHAVDKPVEIADCRDEGWRRGG